MDLVDLLNGPAASLPREGRDDFEEQLQELFELYFEEFQRVSATDDASEMARHHLPASRELADKILEALGHWLDGQPTKAAEAIDAALNSVGAALREHVSVPLMDAEIGPLYRLSEVDQSPVPRGRLFHIPFQLRDRVSTQRYSFPGLPCLYLGRSSYICWIECGCPPLESSWVSRFGIAKNQVLRVLDFGRSPAMTAAMLQSEPTRWSMAAAYAVLWPLVAGCSVKRRVGSAGGFVVEYVIPQLLLRWIAADGLKANWAPETRIDGIRFFSTRVDADKLGPAAMSYAFPAQQRARTGHCQTLAAKLHLTDPTRWKVAAGHPKPATDNNVQLALHGARVHYHDTEFSRIEGLLKTLPLHPV